MEKRQLGRSNIHIAPLCFGGNVFGWTADRATSFRLLDAFVAAGFDFIDTADVYSRWVHGHEGGESEAIIGEWVASRKNRASVVIATKVGSEMGPGMNGLAKQRIRDAVEASLRRLQTDYIDLYQSHYDDPETPVEETLETYSQLISEGKVRVIGASNFTGDRLEESLAASARLGFARYETFQPEYNLCERERFEREFSPICAREGIGVIPYYSLAAGFLTGKYRSEADLKGRARAARAGRYLNERGFRILDALDGAAKDLDATPAQIAIAWLMARPTIAAPIASATSLAQLEDLVAATRLALPPEKMAKLDAASAPGRPG
jgi:aryl-alcohol dehydrogenase-like predicted oxidoreductase